MKNSAETGLFIRVRVQTAYVSTASSGLSCDSNGDCSEVPLNLPMQINIVDVRDVAEAHQSLGRR